MKNTRNPSIFGESMIEKSIHLAKTLKTLRKNHGISNSTLMEEIKEKYGITISADSLETYECYDPQYPDRFGRNMKMKLERIVVLADYYGVSVDYLLGSSAIKTPDLVVHSIMHETGISEENTITLREAKRVLEKADHEEQTICIQRLAPYINIREPSSPSSFYRALEYCSNIFSFLNHVMDAYRHDKAIKKSYISLCRGIYYSDDARYFGMSAVETKELICDRIGARIAKHLKETNLSDQPYDEERAINADEFE